MANAFSKHLTVRLVSITSLASLITGCSIAENLPFIGAPPPPFDAGSIQEAYKICLKKNKAYPPDETQEEYDARLPETLKKGDLTSFYKPNLKNFDRVITIKSTCFPTYYLKQFGWDKDYKGVYVMVGEVERIHIPYDKNVGYDYDDKERRPRVVSTRVSLTTYPTPRPPKTDD